VIGRQSRFVLWIDSVAAVLVCPHDEVWIGQAVPNAGVQLPFQANLRRRHLRLRREDGRYWMEEPGVESGAGAVPTSPAEVAPREVAPREMADGAQALAGSDSSRVVVSGQEISLGQGLGLRLRIPSPLTSTAVLDYLGPLRSVPRTDFAILMAQACLLGSTTQHHILIPELDQATLFFRESNRESQLSIKARQPLSINGTLGGAEATLHSGDHIECAAFSLTIEVLRDTR
jgi:hypothetical protein